MPKHLTVNDTADFLTATNIGQPNGVAGLDSSGKVPTANLPTTAVGVSSVNGHTGDVLLDATGLGVIPTGAIGVPLGVAGLDSSGRLPVAKLPTVAVQSVNGYNGPSVTLAAADIGALTQSLADARYFLKTGGTVSGAATVTGELYAQGALKVGAVDAGATTDLFSQGGVMRAGSRAEKSVALRPLPTDGLRFPLDTPASVLYKKRVTAAVTAIQSIGVDSRAGIIYIGQIISGSVQLADESAPVPYDDRESRGDNVISKMTLDGTLLAKMYIRGAGHGTTASVEYGLDGKTWLWVGGDASGSGFSRALHRIEFVADAILDSDDLPLYRPATGMHGVMCAVDTIHRKIAVHQTWPDPDTGTGLRRARLYDLDDAAQNIWVYQAEVTYAVNQASPAMGTFQGMTTYGSYIYLLDGGPGDPIYITCMDWRSNKVLQRQLMTILPDLTYRESEGLSVWHPNPDRLHEARLCWGWVDGGTGNRDSSITYIQASPPRPTVPAPMDHKLLAWSLDPLLANASSAPTSGQLQLVRVRLASPAVVSSVMLYAGTAGSGLSAGANRVGIYSTSDGTLLASSADQTSAWGSTGTKTTAMTAPIALPAGSYFVGILCVGATTPAWTRVSAQGGNMGLSAADTRCGTYGTGLAALPSTLTLSSIGSASVAYVAGLL